MRMVKSALVLAAVVLLAVVMGGVASAQAITVHIAPKPTIAHDVHVGFAAGALPDGGYYYAVIALRPYKHYTRRSPPPCSSSSNMARTAYGYPSSAGAVALALSPTKSKTHHWCRGGSYEGAVYAVPHAPPCESKYPCGAETYEQPCAGVGPGCIEGLIPVRKEWAYPDGVPAPLASDTKIVARFSVRMPSR